MAIFARAPLLCAAFLAIVPLLCALDENKIEITLYLHIVWGGPATNEIVVVGGSSNRYGEIRVNQWTIFDGPDPSSAKVIGRAQGLSISAQPMIDGSSWHVSETFVFSDDSKYSGSTIEISGIIRTPPKGVVNELSIVGGTGKFTMARGVAKYNYVKQFGDSSILKVNLLAYYSSTMDFTAVYAEDK